MFQTCIRQDGAEYRGQVAQRLNEAADGSKEDNEEALVLCRAMAVCGLDQLTAAIGC